MRVGFELELVVKRSQYDAIRNKLRPQFNFSYDGSIRTQNNSEVGLEIKSIPIEFSDVNVQLDLLKETFSDYTITTNESCGFHIHLDFIKIPISLRKRSVINITKLWYNNQSLIVKLCSENRENNGYTAQLKYEYISDIIKQKTDLGLYKSIYKNRVSATYLKRYKTLIDNETAPRNELRKGSDRFKTLNLMTILDLGTIELRVFQSTLDIERIKFYLTLANNLAVKAIQTQKVRLIKYSKYAARDKRMTTKRLWEFLRCINMVDKYKYARAILRGV